ncbi:MAG: hypothetical protein ACI9BH_001748 [Paracoccaceae bacterium]|jgi:hypothetical protein
MCSNDHKVMMTLKLGPWRDDAVGGVLLSDLTRSNDVPSRRPGLFSTLLARLPRRKK